MLRTFQKMDTTAIRLFFFILYGESTYPWIRRHGFRFAVEVRGLKVQTGINKRAETEALFTKLQNLGWIYNLRSDVGTIRFTVRPPHWLGLSDTAPLTERYVQWDRKYDGDNSHITYDYIKQLSDTYPERRKAFDNLVEAQIQSDSDGPKTPEEILGE